MNIQLLWNDLINPAAPFLRLALLAGILGSIAFGTVGTFVVSRRIVSLAGAVSHSVLGGIGMAIYLQNVWKISWFTPLLGALLSAVLAAVIIWYVNSFVKEREDAIIGAIWALGMAWGLLFMALTPGYVDLQMYLFGNILLANWNDLFLVCILDAVVLLGIGWFYPKLLAVCFDSEFAVIRGVRASWVYLVMLLVTALTIVVTVNVVGILLVIALLSLPAMTAGMFAKHWWVMMLYSVLICLFCTTGGLAVSYSMDLPSGPVIVLGCCAVYVAGMLYAFLKNKFKTES